MKPRIGLIADQSTLDELSVVMDRSRFGIFESGFHASQIDAVLFVPGGERASRSLNLFMKELDPAESDRLLLAALCPRAIHPGSIQPFVPVPSLSVFYQLANLKKREYLVLNEARLREQTLAVLNAPHSPAQQNSRNREHVLFMGEPSPFFLRCTHDLQAAGKQVNAVITERTAFEALKIGTQDAFVFTVSANNVPFELLDHIHGRADLRDLPVIAVAAEPENIPDFGDRVSALINIGSDDTENLIQVMSVLKRQTLPLPLQSKQSIPAITDRYSGAFSKAFAEIHLKAQIENALTLEDEHSAAVLHPFDSSSGDPLKPDQFSRFVQTVREVLRREDFIARLDWERFLISLPGCGQSDAEKSMHRLQSLIETTSQGMSSRPLSFRYALKTLHPHQTADLFWRAIETGSNSSPGRQAAVA